MRRPMLSVAAILALASCSDSPDTSGATATPSPTAGATTTPTPTDSTTASTAPAPAALQFTAPLVGGGNLDFTGFAGRTVALWFWAPT